MRQHPDIEECAVIGVPGEVGEQDIKLFVELKPGRRHRPAMLVAWCADRLAGFQLPRYIVEVERFDKTASERIIKHALPRDIAGAWDRLAPVPANSDSGGRRGAP